jgi:hypothetical protein
MWTFVNLSLLILGPSKLMFLEYQDIMFEKGETLSTSLFRFVLEYGNKITGTGII